MEALFIALFVLAALTLDCLEDCEREKRAKMKGLVSEMKATLERMKV
jgi:hypothetical protein